MSACTFMRVDSRNTSTTQPKYASRPIYDPVGGDIMLAFMDMGVGGGSPQPGSIRFVRFDPDTHLPHSEVAILSDYAFVNTISAIDMVRIDDGSTHGRLIVAWYSDATVAPGNNVCSASESTDGGATWNAPVNVTTVNAQMWSLAIFDTTVWLLSNVISSGGGFGAGDFVGFKRTGVDTWAAGIRVYDSGGLGGTPGAFQTTMPNQAHLAAGMTSATVGFVVGIKHADGGPNTMNRLIALTTADGWATASVVAIKTFTAGITGALNVVKTTSGRFYLQMHDPDNSQKPRLFYTDNSGTNWTELGIPTAYSDWLTLHGLTGDSTFDCFLALDIFENLLLGQSSQGALSPNGLHVVFRSVNPLTDAWVTQGECTYNTTVDTVQSATAGRGVVDPDTGDCYRLIGMSRTFFTLEFIAVEGLPPEPEPPPPVPPAIESGSDDNNLMFRIDLAEGRGWSLHAMPPSCFMAWPEGDAETGPEVHLTLIGNPTMDPGLQDPTLLWGIRRIETDLEYGWRVFVSDGTNTHTRNDPMRMYIRTKEFTVVERKGEGLRNVARQAFFTYNFDAPPGEVLPVQVWVDRTKQNRTIELPTTFGEEVSEWFSLPTALNVGETVQFVVDEISNYPVSFDAFGLSYIPKGRRS